MGDTLGRRSRMGGASFVGGVWKGNPDVPRGIPIPGADGGGGGVTPSGVPKIDPVDGTLGRRSRGGGGAFVGGVWKGNPDGVSGAGTDGASGGGAAPSGVPKSEPVGGTLGKRSRGGGGASLIGGVWNGNPDELSGAGIEGSGVAGGGAGVLGEALDRARGGGAVNADAGGTLGKRSRCGGESPCASGVWKGNTGELLKAAKRCRTDVGSSGACAVGRNGSAGSVEGDVLGMSVFPIFTPALDATGGAFENGKSVSVLAALEGFGAV